MSRPPRYFSGAPLAAVDPVRQTKADLLLVLGLLAVVVALGAGIWLVIR